MTTVRKRIYADFNGLQQSSFTEGCLALYLHYWGSLVDLSKAHIQLKEGILLDVYSDSDENEDLEVTGLVHFDRKCDQWFVEFSEKDIRYVPTPKKSTNEAIFPCWKCSEDLNTHIKKNGLKLGDLCIYCKSEIHGPLNPPENV